MTDNALAVSEARPVAEVAMGEAASVARNEVCRQIVDKTAIKIKGRGYLKVEGWRAIAAAHGCTLSSGDVQRVQSDDPDHSGYRAVGRVVRSSDGAVLAEAEGFVGDREPLWSKRDVFARRAMAQTRAQSRAAKSVFDFVVVLMGDYETTPAEEMIDHGPAAAPAPKPKPAPTPPQQQKQQPAPLPPSSALKQAAEQKLIMCHDFQEVDTWHQRVLAHREKGNLTGDHVKDLMMAMVDHGNHLRKSEQITDQDLREIENRAEAACKPASAADEGTF